MVCFYSTVCGKNRNQLMVYIWNRFSSVTDVVPFTAHGGHLRFKPMAGLKITLGVCKQSLLVLCNSNCEEIRLARVLT